MATEYTDEQKLKIQEQAKRIKELESEIEAKQKEADEAKIPQFVIMATVPNIEVEVEYYNMPRTIVNAAGQQEQYNDKLQAYLKQWDTLYMYPADVNDGIELPIPLNPMMRDITARHSHLGIVIWEKRKETKEQAAKRGLTAYSAYIFKLKDRIAGQHSEMKQVQRGEAIPDKDNYQYKYANIYPHLLNEEPTRKALTALARYT